MFVNAIKICQFKAKDSEIKDYALCLCTNVSKDLTNDNMEKKKTGLKGVLKCFTADFNPIDTNNIIDIHKF